MPEHRYAELRAGNQRFARRRAAVAVPGRQPVAVLSCIDGRVPVETLFDLPSARIYSVRIAGNVVSDDVVASLELAVAEGGAALVVVLGHTRCLAVGYACDGDMAQNAPGGTAALLDRIRPAVAATPAVGERNADNEAWVDAVARENACRSKAALLAQSPLLARRVADGSLGVVAAMYDVRTGAVEFLDALG